MKTTKNVAKTTKNVAKVEAKKRGATNLRQPQIRILQVLAKAKKPMTRKDIVEAAGANPSKLDPAWMGTWIGPIDADVRTASDAKYNLKSLLTLKAVTMVELEDVTGIAYTITAAGRMLIKNLK